MATMRGLEILSNLGCDLRILQIEGAKDPDEFIIKFGKGRLEKHVEEAISLVEFKIKILKDNLNIENTSDRIKFLNEIAKILSKVNNNIEMEVYIEKISKVYGISKEAIYSEIKKISNKKVGSSKILERNIPKNNITKKENTNINESILKRENTIISILISGGIYVYEIIKNELTPEDFRDNTNKKIVKTIYTEFENGKKEILDYTILFEEEDVINHITEIMTEDYGIENTKKGIKDILKKYKKEKLIERKNEIIILMNSEENKNNKQITDEFKTIVNEIAKL